MTKLGFEVQKRVGAAEPRSFSEAFFFCVCVGRARKFDARWVRGRVNSSVGFGVVGKNGLAAAVRRVFTSFSVFFLRPLFCKLKVVLFTPPSFCLGVFLFCSPSSWDWGQCRIARVFLGSWPSIFFFVFVFGVFLQKHCFPPDKRVILVHFSVSPFRSPWLLSLLFVTLSLSLSIFFLVFFFPSLLSCLYFYLPCFLALFLVLFLRFCFMKRTTSKYYI